jgi:hypothetical protein
MDALQHFDEMWEMMSVHHRHRFMTALLQSVTVTGNDIELDLIHLRRRSSMRITGTIDPNRVMRPYRVARMLAVAHIMKQKLESGEFTDLDRLAAAAGFSKARVSQLLDLTLLAPDIQEELLFAEQLPGRDPIHERSLRSVLRNLAWSQQRKVYSAQWQRNSKRRSPSSPPTSPPPYTRQSGGHLSPTSLPVSRQVVPARPAGREHEAPAAPLGSGGVPRRTSRRRSTPLSAS